MKLLFWVVLIYIGYRFYTRHQWLNKGFQKKTTPEQPGEYVDYEEID